MIENYANKYKFHTYSGKKLLEKHSLTETGTWEIIGEECHNLGILEGVLEDVIKTALCMPNFDRWGGGGSIRKVKKTSAGTTKDEKLAELLRQKSEIERQIKALKLAPEA